MVVVVVVAVVVRPGVEKAIGDVRGDDLRRW